MSEHQPYYGKVICRDQQQIYIDKTLAKYKGESATEELRKKVYDDLMWEKHLGNVLIPFKVILNKDESGHGMDYIDILLDSKV
jgi:hypothetical protein